MELKCPSLNSAKRTSTAMSIASTNLQVLWSIKYGDNKSAEKSFPFWYYYSTKIMHGTVYYYYTIHFSSMRVPFVCVCVRERQSTCRC